MTRRRKVPTKETEMEAPEPLAKKVVKAIKEKPSKKFKNEPDWMAGDGATVANLFLSIQKSDCNSAKMITELKKLYKKMGHHAFTEVLNKAIILFLIRDENDEYAPRVLKFIGLFVAEFGEDMDENNRTHLIIQYVFKEILDITSKHYHVRARICQLVSFIMASFSQKAEIDESIMDHVIERMLTTFIKDISPIVRENAILALQRLQDPENPDDPVTRAYIYHMETDPVSKVRQAAITAIAKKLSIVNHIIDRLRDSDEKVRRHTYLQIASYSVKTYKISDRIKIIKAGLYDRSVFVKKAVNNILLPNWIAAYDDDYAKFCKAFNLESSDELVIEFRSLSQDALAVIFKKRKLSDLINFLGLNKENEFKNCLSIEKTQNIEWLVVWKAVIKLHQEQLEGRKRTGGDQLEDNDESEDEHYETLSNIETIPELMTFCEYVESFVSNFNFSSELDMKSQKLKFNHSVIVLLEIARLNDFGDEIGRIRLQELLKKILLEFDVSEFTIKEISQVMEILISNPVARMKFFHDIVDEMVSTTAPNEYSRQAIIDELISQAGDDVQLEATGIKMKMMELKEQESKFVQEKVYGKAQKVAEDYLKTSQSLIDLLKPYAQETSRAMLESMSSTVTLKKQTPASILKNLRICFYALNTKGVKSLTPEFLNIYNSFVRYYLESNDTATRVWALRTATAYSLLYEALAKDVYLLLKSQLFKCNIAIIWETTIGCIVDLLLRYSIVKMESREEALSQDMSDVNASQNRTKKGGRTLYNEDGEDAEDIDMVESIDIIQMLIHVLDNNTEVRVHKATLIGLCKLIIHGQYYSRELVSRFMISYFNPATEAEINQTLGIFFETIIKLKKQESLHDALFPTLVTLLEAPNDSPLREVKIETVVKYVVGATRPVFCSNGLNLHNTLGLKLIDIMKNNNDNKEILKIFSREMLNLEISEDPSLKKDIVVQIENLLKTMKCDARTKKNVTDFRDILSGTFKKALKFSSTAAAPTFEEGEEDEGVQGEDEEEEAEADEGLETVAEERDESDVVMDETEKNPQITVVDTEQEEPSNAFEIPATQESETSEGSGPNLDLDVSAEMKRRKLGVHREKSPLSQDIEIPPTQAVVQEEEDDDSEVVSVSEEGQNETVIGTRIESSDDEKSEPEEEKSFEEIPETPEPAIPKSSRKTATTTKRQLERSLVTNSPLYKNPRNGRTPKFDKSVRKTQSPEPEQSTPATPTPARIPVTPRTPRLQSLQPPAFSTPKSDRVTRKQAQAEIAQNTTLTRSASRKINLEPVIEEEKNPPKKQEPKPNAKVPVSKIAVKKSALPVPTKTSLIRASRMAKASGKPAAQPKSTEGRTNRQRAGTSVDPKGRPLWK